MFSRSVDFVYDEILAQVVLIAIDLFFGDNQLPVSQLGDRKLLRPDIVDFVVDFEFGLSMRWQSASTRISSLSSVTCDCYGVGRSNPYRTIRCGR